MSFKRDRDEPKRPRRRGLGRWFSIGYFLLAFFLVWLFGETVYKPYFSNEKMVGYSEFLDDLARKDVKVVEMIYGGNTIAYALKKDASEFRIARAEGKEPDERTRVTVRMNDPDLMTKLALSGAEFGGSVPKEGVVRFLLFRILLPLLPLLLFWVLLSSMMRTSGGIMSFGKNKAKEIQGEMTGVTFRDLGGVGEAEIELRELIEFLSKPKRFKQFGAKTPKGVLLAGPPGTGKTMLAKAVAGEAKVPFFFISGSAFVELFVGLGASRVRDLFEQAGRKAPCIIFIDEIDAIGGRRMFSSGGGDDERHQTLNQLLSEMDGFSGDNGVVIMAATNRPESLDDALLRPGRFDRQIQIVLPTEPGRLEILNIHTRKMKLDENCDLECIARITPGFSGADLANMCNEAALMAIRRGADRVSREDFDLAIERVVAGLQRKTPLSPEIRKRVAYHEVGHALVARETDGVDPVHKISIIPTTKGALGYTLQMPTEDRYIVGRSHLEGTLTVLMGGRSAERIVFGDTSTGSTNDLERATVTAFRMVAEFGMSERIGPVRLAEPNIGTYLTNTPKLREDLGDALCLSVHAEIGRIVSEASDKADAILMKHIDALHGLAEILQERETITGEEMEAFLLSLPDSPIKKYHVEPITQNVRVEDGSASS